MVVKPVVENWRGQVTEMVIGRAPRQIRVGGDASLPFLKFEGKIPNKPVAALEVLDTEPEEWPQPLLEALAGYTSNPVIWAQKCIEYGAEMICLRLASTDPEGQNSSPARAADVARAVAEAVDVPLIITGCGVEEKDADVLPAVCEAISGQNALIGCATANNYKSIAAAVKEHGHNIIASSPLDINLAKQLNILISEMDIPPSRIAIDPLVGPLGYGLEYAYSIMERIRLGALSGDRMLAMPVICFVGQEVWKVKEARTESEEWGELNSRAVLWELVTASSLAQAGGSIFVFRHPLSLKHFQTHIASLM